MASSVTRYSMITTESYGRDPTRDITKFYGYKKTVEFFKNNQPIDALVMINELILASNDPSLSTESEILPERTRIRALALDPGSATTSAHFCKVINKTNFLVRSNNT